MFVQVNSEKLRKLIKDYAIAVEAAERAHCIVSVFSFSKQEEEWYEAIRKRDKAFNKLHEHFPMYEE